MPEPLDLDALKRKLAPYYGTLTSDEQYALIAELEATRAERGQALLAATIQGASAREQYDRAERAEAANSRVRAWAESLNRSGRLREGVLELLDGSGQDTARLVADPDVTAYLVEHSEESLRRAERYARALAEADIRNAELAAAIARVEALCDGWSDPGRGYVSVAGVRAALRGES